MRDCCTMLYSHAAAAILFHITSILEGLCLEIHDLSLTFIHPAFPLGYSLRTSQNIACYVYIGFPWYSKYSNGVPKSNSQLQLHFSKVCSSLFHCYMSKQFLTSSDSELWNSLAILGHRSQRVVCRSEGDMHRAVEILLVGLCPNWDSKSMDVSCSSPSCPVKHIVQLPLLEKTREPSWIVLCLSQFLQGLYPHFVSAKIPISSGCLTSITCIRNFWTSLAPYLDLKLHYATFSPNISQQASRKWVAVKLFHHYLKAINLFGVGYPPCMDLPIQSNPIHT